MAHLIESNICKLRKASNCTQEQIADYLGVSCLAYSNYELGVAEMPLDLAEKLANLFGCDLSLILDVDQEAVKGLLVCHLNLTGLSSGDLKQIATFNNIVMNYMKMIQLEQNN